ncbi:MAG: Uma2 family endonuclease [Chloroflexota bacterium]
MTNPARLLTYDDLARLPSDGRRREIIEGALVVSPVPSPAHQRVVGNVLMELWPGANAAGELFVGPVDVVLSPSDVVEPDLVYLDRSVLHFVTERAIKCVPTLVIQMLSPGSIDTDRAAKLNLYARFGVPYYWIVDPIARTIEGLVLTSGRYHLTTRLGAGTSGALTPFEDVALDIDALLPA